MHEVIRAWASTQSQPDKQHCTAQHSTSHSVSYYIVYVYLATGEDCVCMVTVADYLAEVISQMYKVREYQALAVFHFTQWA